MLLERKQSSLCWLVCLKSIYHQSRGLDLAARVWGNWFVPVENEGAWLQSLWQACGVKHYFSFPFNHVDKLSMKTILFLNWKPNKVGVENVRMLNRKCFLVKKANERSTELTPCSVSSVSSGEILLAVTAKGQFQQFLTTVHEHRRKNLALILLVLTGI